MSAKDTYHNQVISALKKDNWQITHDPLIIELSSGRQLRVDLGAENLIAADKQLDRIAVEIKSFLAPSTVSEFHTALGQFLNYRVALRVKEPERVLFLAVPKDIYDNFFFEEIAQLSVQEYQVKLLIFDPDLEEIVTWKN